MQIAERMGRLGTETAFDVLARAGALQAAGRSIINLGIGQPDFRTPDHIVEAGRKALADGHHGYTPANGIPALREAVAADIATYRHCEVDPDKRRGGAGRQGHDVLCSADVRRAGGRDPVSQSGLPHLRIGDQVLRRHAGADTALRGDRLLLRRRRGAGQDHAAYPARHAQQPGQPDRRRRSAGDLRPPGPRTRGPSARRDHERRDLQPPALRGPRACHDARLSGASGPRDRARRLEQDLCDDRLAHRLRGLARVAGGACHAARDQLQLLRQRADPARGARGAHRPAGVGRDHAPHLRRAPAA